MILENEEDVKKAEWIVQFIRQNFPLDTPASQYPHIDALQKAVVAYREKQADNIHDPEAEQSTEPDINFCKLPLDVPRTIIQDGTIDRDYVLKNIDLDQDPDETWRGGERRQIVWSEPYGNSIKVEPLQITYKSDHYEETPLITAENLKIIKRLTDLIYSHL